MDNFKAARIDKFMTDRKRKILLVDDQRINLTILSKLLSPTYDILKADNGFDALEILKSCGTDISAVLLDAIMPEMSGYEVLEKIRLDPLFKKLPVIVITQPDGNND